jgi:hypothetical protein
MSAPISFFIIVVFKNKLFFFWNAAHHLESSLEVLLNVEIAMFRDTICILVPTKPLSTITMARKSFEPFTGDFTRPLMNRDFAVT